MTFYIEPPTGNISLDKLETFATNRLKFLIELFDVRESSQRKGFGELFGIERVTVSDCLIEGTHKDLISHFVLRICLASDPDSALFLRHAESFLFNLRLQSFTERDLYRFLRKTEAGLQRLVDSKDSQAGRTAYEVLLQIKGNNHWKSVAKFCTMESTQHMFSVPFESALKLVAQREVTLNRGRASVAYKYLKDVLLQCYDDFLCEDIKEFKSRYSVEDVRIKRLSYKLKYILTNLMAPGLDYSLDLPPLRAIDVLAESQFFPPCMKYLVEGLQSVHRLRHHARIQLTLFLKEIGMPVYEALQFWRSEYSKVSPMSEDGCPHHWQQNSRRYTYNIRHLYGLEGSKVNYRGHCCLSLQGCSPGPGDCGGCPFRHSDKEHLYHAMEVLPSGARDKITGLCNKGRYSEACGALLQERVMLYKETEVSTRLQFSMPDTNGKVQTSGFSKTCRKNCVNNNMNCAQLAKPQKCDHSEKMKMQAVQSNSYRPIADAEDSYLENCNTSNMTNRQVSKTISTQSNVSAEELFIQNCETKCYEHELCLSQLCCLQASFDSELTDEDIVITKPSEFYYRLKHYILDSS